MEELSPEVMKTIMCLHDTKMKQKAKAETMGNTDKYGFPFEPCSSFSTEPLEFTETAIKLHSETLEVFTFLTGLNRHSPQFYQMSGRLEKLLGQLGSVCITKAVMEQQGKTFRIIEDLNIKFLRECTAFVFRKSYASFMESMGSFRYNDQALWLSIRFSALDKRLLATEEKIRLIRKGKVRVDLCPETPTPEAPSGAAPLPEKKEVEQDPAAFRAAGNSLPVDKAAVREMTGEELSVKPVRKSIRSSAAAAANAPEEADEEKTAAEAVPTETGPVTRADEETIISGSKKESDNSLPDPEETPRMFQGSAEKKNDTEENKRSEINCPAEETKIPDKASGKTGPEIPDETDTESEEFPDREGKESEEIPDPAAGEETEFPDPAGAEFCDDANDLPYVSEDLVRRMSALINSPEYSAWPCFEPAYAGSPP
ncbi:MAG: hypothetical protein IKP86_01595 [Anaerolineaceae bacterium]|nr:hypothetical protein [Anaerolineaceae bacterium]